MQKTALTVDTLVTGQADMCKDGWMPGVGVETYDGYIFIYIFNVDIYKYIIYI